MHTPQVGCQQFALVAPRRGMTATTEMWQLAAGLEAIAILVLLAGWLNSVQTTHRGDHADRSGDT